MKTSAEKMAEFSKRRKDAGIVQISTWVPAARRADILRLAQAWREGSLFTLPDDLGVVSIDRPGIASVNIDRNAGNSDCLAPAAPDSAEIVPPAPQPATAMATIEEPIKPRRRGPAPASEAVVMQRVAYGQRIRAAREAKGLAPAELGRRLGYRGVLRVEQGKNMPPPAVRNAIARILRVTP